MKHNHLVYTMLAAGSALVLGGCSQVVLFVPKGPIGHDQRTIIITAFILMMIVVIPVFILAWLFPRKYKASNTRSPYTPKWSYSKRIDLIVWLVPLAITFCIAAMTWIGTLRLDPYKAINPGTEPLRIEAVALDWKWLFIYPDLKIAAVNRLVFPVGVPLSFRVTSHSVMTSFFIPQLGSQIYAMPGMRTRLHLLADEPGTYEGQNQQLSGDGYSYMFFTAAAVAPEDFEAWVSRVRQSPEHLDRERFDLLSQATMGYPVIMFSSVIPGLFDDIIRRFNPGFEEADPGHREDGSAKAEEDVAEESNDAG